MRQNTRNKYSRVWAETERNLTLKNNSNEFTFAYFVFFGGKKIP